MSIPSFTDARDARERLKVLTRHLGDIDTVLAFCEGVENVYGPRQRQLAEITAELTAIQAERTQQEADLETLKKAVAAEETALRQSARDLKAQIDAEVRNARDAADAEVARFADMANAAEADYRRKLAALEEQRVAKAGELAKIEGALIAARERLQKLIA